MTSPIRLIAGAVSATLLLAAPASAQSVADFYKGKTIQMQIGFGPGASYDLYGRFVADYIGRYIPGNPQVVSMNMEGAGSLRVVNWLYNVAPKDGTVLATASRAAPFAPLLGAAGGTSFDASKFTWIGSANNEVSTCVAWGSTGITSLGQLRETELIIGGDGAGADGEQFARVMNDLFGTRIKIVSGYPGGNAINLALERGEVRGRCGWSWSGIKAERMHWVTKSMMNVFVQFGLSKHPDLPNVEMITDYAKTDEQKQMLSLVLARQPLGRPFMAPPGVPADRTEALRQAFMKTMQDRDFLAATEKARLEINPLGGTAVAALVDDVYTKVSPAVIQRTRDILTRK